MYWVFGFYAKNLKSVNKTMLLLQLPLCVFQPTITIKGGTTFFGFIFVFVLTVALDLFVLTQNPHKPK
jgi:hypothetical protein